MMIVREVSHISSFLKVRHDFVQHVIDLGPLRIEPDVKSHRGLDGFSPYGELVPFITRSPRLVDLVLHRP